MFNSLYSSQILSEKRPTMIHRQVFIAVILSYCLFTACKTYDFSLTFSDIEQPIHMGKIESSTSLDTLDVITGFSELEFEEETYSENENTSITLSGGEYYYGNMESTIIQAIQSDPTYLMGDTEIQLEIKHGIRVGAFIFGNIAAAITGSESDVGTFTVKKFTQTSVLYRDQ